MDKALQVREILSTRGLTLYGVSRRSAEIFGRSSKFYVPHNLYYNLARPPSKPTIYQILALSQITRYRLSDWLKVFGLDLDRILRLQLLIPRRRTIPLDSTVYDTYAWIPWFAERPHFGPVPAIAPLGYFLASALPKRAKDLLALNMRRFRYAIVGDQDLYALPYFAPGSIIRVDALRVEELQLGRKPNEEDSFFLVEHDLGWTCSRLTLVGKDRVLLNCPLRPCTEHEFRIGRDARILGVIDAEIHPLNRHHQRGSIETEATLRNQRVEHLSGERANFKDLLRYSRMKVGLSFREASSISRFIADTLADELYFAAASTLSDYEAIPAPPRHIQKVITLCLLYCIGFHEFLRACRLPLNQAGREPMPDELVPRLVSGENHSQRIADPDGVGESNGFLPALVNRWEEVPLYLRFSLDEISGFKGLCLSDVFWVGGDKAPRHPLLVNAGFVVVNRRSRKPSPREESLCGESLYLVLTRDGSYLCGRCTLDKGNLVVHGHPRSPVGTQRFKNDTEAEVVGQITAILRRLA